MLLRLFTVVFLGALLVQQLPSRRTVVVVQGDREAATEEPTGVNRALASFIVMDHAVVFEGARLVPSLKNGTVWGFKVYAIRPGSLADVLGFQNGDTFHAVVNETTHLRFDITRGGTPSKLLVPISES